MGSKWMTRLGLAALAVAVGWGSVGCAQERDPINRVQPNALPKAFFLGADWHTNGSQRPEFWARNTVVDVGYGASQSALFTSTYAQPVARIKWDISGDGDFLLGRLAHERIADSDGKGKGGPQPEGIVAYSYRIESHFDIRRDYNPGTGEEGNTTVENATDRPWQDREYIRVDWSRNLSTDNYEFDTLSMLGVYGGIRYEPMAFAVENPNDANYPVFDVAGGYFDITNKAFAQPNEIDLSALGWGIDSFPACMLPPEFGGGTEPVGQCSPVEITLRQSFVKVPKFDYEPKDWDGYRFQAFGAFTEERRGYARTYGMVDKQWHRFITRYDVWVRDHYYANEWKDGTFKPNEDFSGGLACNTSEKINAVRAAAGLAPLPSGGDQPVTRFGDSPNRDADANGTADECEAVSQKLGIGGSQCDVFTKLCTLPYQARVAKPIKWYMNIEGSTDFQEGTEMAAHEWDVAMRSALMTAKYAECQKVGGENCEGRFPVYFGQQDENDDAIELAQEVDACRSAVKDKSPEAFAQADKACQAKADQIGGQRGYSKGVIALAKMPEQIVLCHSPVEQGDAAACAPPEKRLPANLRALDCKNAWRATTKNGQIPSSDPRAKDKLDTQATVATCNKSIVVRLGDLRYNVVNNIDKPQDPSAWGIYTDAEDPLTGKKIGAAINLWTHINDLFSQGIVDQLRYIKKEFTTADITNGVNIHDWAAAADAAYAFPKMTKAQVTHDVASLAGRSGVTDESQLPALSPKAEQAAYDLKEKVYNIRADIKAASTMAPVYEARRQLARGTPLEAALMTTGMQQYSGVNKAPIPTASKTKFGSVLQLANPSLNRELRNAKEVALAERGACIMADAPAPLGNTALANLLEKKFGKFDDPACGTAGRPACQDKQTRQDRAQKMFEYLRQKVHYAVVIHEMGHSVGLRHNFVSSSDPLNYRPQYWQLRTRNGTVNTPCTDLQADGSKCVGPRYWDPVDQVETDNLVWMWMQSSVMDYAGEPTQDLLGLGAYDFAAARMFYGDVVQVYQDETYKAGKPRAVGLQSKIDNFGGIIGLQYKYGSGNQANIHYSQLQAKYELIKDCKPVDPNTYKPSNWNTAKMGEWNPVIDGKLVSVDGQTYSRCKTQPTDYVQWENMAFPKGVTPDTYRGGPAYDRQTRLRVPHGFATDSWADLGNLSVYRHDNGADPYELFTFLQVQPEVLHIFNDYRRGRSTFSVRSASNRYLTRYNEKLRDAAKGLGLLVNIYRSFYNDLGLDFNSTWPTSASRLYRENILVSGMGFDQFARQLQRPESGDHFRDDATSRPGIFQSVNDYIGNEPTKSCKAPGAQNPCILKLTDGASGYFGNVSYGGRLLENKLGQGNGEYNRDYTQNVGSYYDKIWSAMLFTESVDNFISDSRGDFLDPRYRAVSVADVFPDGYRRLIANALTGDEFIKGVRVAANAAGMPITDDSNFISSIGWTSWWNVDGPKACFPGAGSTVCSIYSSDPTLSDPFKASAPANTAILDSQIGFEQQKFIIAMTMAYLPENQKMTWLDQLRIFEVGSDSDPGFEDRIQFNHPNGKIFVAKSSGKETIFGKQVEKNIGARVLEYANTLLRAGYETEDILSGTRVVGYKAKLRADGTPIVKFDKGVQGPPDCKETINTGCTVTSNRAAVELESYVSVPVFMRQALAAFGMADPRMKGLY